MDARLRGQDSLSGLPHALPAKKRPNLNHVAPLYNLLPVCAGTSLSDFRLPCQVLPAKKDKLRRVICLI